MAVIYLLFLKRTSVRPNPDITPMPFTIAKFWDGRHTGLTYSLKRKGFCTVRTARSNIQDFLSWYFLELLVGPVSGPIPIWNPTLDRFNRYHSGIRMGNETYGWIFILVIGCIWLFRYREFCLERYSSDDGAQVLTWQFKPIRWKP